MNTSKNIDTQYKKINLRNWFFVSVVLSVFSLYAEHCFLKSSDNVLLLLLKTVAYVFIYLAAGLLIDYLYRKYELNHRQRPAMSAVSVLKLSGLFFFVFLIWLIVYYPGVCGADTVNQVVDLLTGTRPLPFSWISGQPEVSALMNDHHPVFTTIIFSVFYKIGQVFFKDPNVGMFLYCLLQVELLAILFSYSIAVLWKFGVPKYVVCSCVIFCCMPFIASFAIAMLKDAMFSLVFLGYYINYVSIAELSIKKREIKKATVIIHILLSLFVALTNKKGIYIALFSNILLFFLTPKSGKSCLYMLAAAVIPYFLVVVVLGKVLFPIMNIYPGGKQEALGFAIQQTSKALMMYPESFSDEDQAVYYRVISLTPGTVNNYFQEQTTDGIKTYFNYYATSEEIRDFVKLWVKQGIKHPSVYMHSLLSVCGGFFAPVKTINVYQETAYSDIIQAFSQPEKLKDIRSGATAFYNWLTRFPPLSLFFQNWLYCWGIPVMVFVLLVMNGKIKYTIMLAPLAANIIFLVLGPVCCSGSALCEIYTVPCVLGIPFRAYDSVNSEQNIL